MTWHTNVNAMLLPEMQEFLPKLNLPICISVPETMKGL